MELIDHPATELARACQRPFARVMKFDNQFSMMSDGPMLKRFRSVFGENVCRY
jgi:hypothetical protein